MNAIPVLSPPEAYAAAWREAAAAHNAAVDAWEEGEDCPKFEAPSGGGKGGPQKVDVPESGEYLYNGQTQPAVTASGLPSMPVALRDPVVHATNPPLLAVTKGRWRQGGKQAGSNCHRHPGDFVRERRLLWVTHGGANDLVALRDGHSGRAIDVGRFVDTGAVEDERTFPVGENGLGGLWADGYVHRWEDLTGGKSISMWNWYVGRAGLSGAKSGGQGVILVPVEVKVDYDRDGEDEILNDPGDNIPDDEFYRFWINDDNDEGDDGAATDMELTGGADSDDDQIDCLRDLEDFTRLHIDLSSVKDMINDGTVQVGLKFVEPSDGTPGIRLFPSIRRQTGSEHHLFDQVAAEAQIGGNYGTALLTVSGSDQWFPQFAFDHMSDDDHLHLLFEGVDPGEAKLALILKFGNSEVVEAPLLPMKLMPVSEMYEHWTAGDYESSVGSRNDMILATAAIPFRAEHDENSGTYAPDGPETDDVIVFVHGFRVKTWERRRTFGDTSFKRLWHSGFKGRFFNFTWPTGYTPRVNIFDEIDLDPPADPDNYADSEEIAYHVGAGPLKNFLDSLNGKYPGKVRLLAHSMGGIVASEALREGAPVHTYAACQTAMGAHAYSAGVPERQPNLGQEWRTPEVYAHYPPTSGRYHRSIVGKIFNFYNEDDNALDGWERSQDLKPNDIILPEGYFCDNFNDEQYAGDFIYAPKRNGPHIDEDVPLAFPDDRYEIFAHGAQVRSFALGAQETPTVPANFNLRLDFTSGANQFFTNARADHSGQWNATMIMRHEFWSVLLDQAFGIKSSKTEE